MGGESRINRLIGGGCEGTSSLRRGKLDISPRFNRLVSIEPPRRLGCSRICYWQIWESAIRACGTLQSALFVPKFVIAAISRFFPCDHESPLYM